MSRQRFLGFLPGIKLESISVALWWLAAVTDHKLRLLWSNSNQELVFEYEKLYQANRWRVLFGEMRGHMK